MSPPVDGYIRVSRVGDREGDSYISPEVQVRAINKIAREKDLTVVMHEPEENVSGGTMDRPIFNEIMARIRSGESGGVLVYRLDRFARTLVGGYSALTEIASHNAIFASASEPQFDFTSPGGRLMLQMHLMMAEYFREVSKENWVVATSHAVERGVHPAPYGAYGYDRTDTGLLVVNLTEAEFVREAFRLRVEEHWTFPDIAKFLNQSAPARRDGRPWTGPSVQRLMGRRVYLGEAFYGLIQNTTGRDAAVNSNAHEPIVDEAMFELAQRAVHSFSKERQGDVALLQGLVRCAGCRYVASPGKSGGLTMYRCRKRYVSGDCTCPSSISRDRLDEYVESIVCGELDRRAKVYAGSANSRELASAKAALDEARIALAEMRDDTTARKRLGGRWMEFIEPYIAEEERAIKHYAEVTSRLSSSVHGMTTDAYRSLDRERRRTALAEMIDAVMIRPPAPGTAKGRWAPPLDDSRALVFWRGQAPDLPTKSRFDPDGIRSFTWPEDEDQARMLVA